MQKILRLADVSRSGKIKTTEKGWLQIKVNIVVSETYVSLINNLAILFLYLSFPFSPFLP